MARRSKKYAIQKKLYKGGWEEKRDKEVRLYYYNILFSYTVFFSLKCYYFLYIECTFILLAPADDKTGDNTRSSSSITDIKKLSGKYI